MTSHPDAITPVSSMVSAETFKGYALNAGVTVELRCRPPGDVGDTLVTSTTSSNTGLPWNALTAYAWSVPAVVPTACWTRVGPGTSGANVWARVGDYEAYRIEDLACAIGASLDSVASCSGVAEWTRLVAPDGASTGSDPLVGNPVPVVVASGLTFAEGPVWEPEYDRLTYTDIQTDTTWQVTPGNAPTVVAAGTGSHANGQAKYLGGPIVRCEHATQRVTMTSGGSTEVVASTYGGNPFNSPNDAAVHPDGTIYFTDPTYGSDPNWGGATPVLGFRGVYRVVPGQAPILEASWGNRQPNGIAFAPDFQTLYVTDTQDGEVLAFAVQTDGSLGPEQHLAWVAGADGMAIDVDGNLLVTGSAGVTALAPNGASWGVLPFTDATNCVFGGEDRTTLFVTTRSTVYAVPLTIPGMPSAY